MFEPEEQIILLIWLFGVVSSLTVGGFIHLLAVMVLCKAVVRHIQPFFTSLMPRLKIGLYGNYSRTSS